MRVPRKSPPASARAARSFSVSSAFLEIHSSSSLPCLFTWVHRRKRPSPNSRIFHAVFTFRGSVSHHAGVQLSGGAGAGWDEATGRFADAGKCNRADDGSLGHAAATRGIELASGTFKNAASYHGRLFETTASCRFRQQEQ